MDMELYLAVPIPSCTVSPGGDEMGIEKKFLFYLREVVLEEGKKVEDEDVDGGAVGYGVGSWGVV